LQSAIPLSFYGLLGVASKMLDIFPHPLAGYNLVLETEVASEVWVRQMTKRAEPIVETDHREYPPPWIQTITGCLACVSSGRSKR
jgi:hypothetical protein